MNYFGIDTTLLNPSNLDKKFIEEAREYLNQIKVSIEQLDAIQNEFFEKQKEPDFEQI